MNILTDEIKKLIDIEVEKIQTSRGRMSYKITEQYKQFLESKEGSNFIKENTNAKSRQDVFRIKKSFLKIPLNVRRWLNLYELITRKIKKDC